MIFIEDLERLENEGILKYLLKARPEYGVTTVVLARSRDELPNACEDIAETQNLRGVLCSLAAGSAGGSDVQFDEVSAAAAESFARKIAGVEVSTLESGGDIPDSLTFLDMWRVRTVGELNIPDRWRKNRTYESMRALIGQKAGGQNWYLDIHEKHHGPHGLVAGTTGSGKSELLQTYILSLALSFSPNDIAFFLIDYKGGGMANLFGSLPHLAGRITNLSGNQVRRAMVSIKSENRRRQQLFNECGVNHIDNYTRLYKNGEVSVPLPHLLIIIDEFAELKKEESSFLRELISVAQVGRSLGVHLILATQKPSGTVDDNIWSNAKFRICLRVQDRQDSSEMLHRPDAAYLTLPGRGYMQVGNDEIFEQFQSGWSGAEYDELQPDSGGSIAGMRTNTGRSAVAGNYQKKQRKDSRRLEWLGALAGMIRAAAAETGLPLARLLDEREGRGRLAAGVYARLDRGRIDYAENRGNTARLLEFAGMLAARGEETDDAAAVREIACSVQPGSGSLPEPRGKTQLAALVDAMNALAAENGFVRPFRLWLPVLPERLYLADLPGYGVGRFDGGWSPCGGEWELEAMVGLCDNPAGQAQFPLVLSLSDNGGLAVCGAAGSGRSTFLQTLLMSLTEHYSPERLNLYILDFSNRSLAPFEFAPHCGGAAYEGETEKIARLFNLLGSMMRQRKLLLQGGTYGQYVRISGCAFPAVLLVIDNYAGFREKTADAYEAQLLTLAREGANCGIFLVLSAGGFGGMEIPNRLADNLRNTVCLEMGDKFKYGDILRTLHFETLPEPGVRGRGIACVQGAVLEYQTALALPAGDDYDRAAKMRDVLTRMGGAWTGPAARKIPEIPAKPLLAELAAGSEYAEAAADPARLPYGYLLADASVASVPLRHTYVWLITGRQRSGKSELLLVLLEGARRKKAQLVFLDFGNGALQGAAQAAGAELVRDAEELSAFTVRFQRTFLSRNAMKQQYLRTGADEDEVFTRMAAEPIIAVFVDDAADFVANVYRANEKMEGLRAFYENAVEKGALHNIYFFVCLNTENMTPLSGRRLYEKMAGYRTGIHLGGDVAAQKVFDFSSMPYLEQNKALRPGLGLLPPDPEQTEIRRVVLPRARGGRT